MAVSTTKSTTTTNKETRLSFYAIERKWRNLLLLFSAFAVSTTHLKKKMVFREKMAGLLLLLPFPLQFWFSSKIIFRANKNGGPSSAFAESTGNKNKKFSEKKMADLLLPLPCPLQN